MNLTTLIEQGNANPLLLIGTAFVLGTLHGLEPGHSKTLMAAFIIAIRGTVSQAVLLGVAAAFSHSLIVWVLALTALTYGDQMIAADLEPWFMLVSGVIIMAIALWVFWQAWRARRTSQDHYAHDHPHDHSHDHSPHHSHTHDRLSADTDAHARAHAQQIEQRFASGQANHWQIIGFGLTGGLIPCPAAVTVLLVCLYLQQFWLGVSLVGAFSIGLALTLVAVGIAAAWGMAVTSRKTSRFDALFANAPYLSAILIGVIGAIMLFSGMTHLEAGHA